MYKNKFRSVDCKEPKGFPHFTKKHKSFMADTLTNGM
jgi:creatine kinase